MSKQTQVSLPTDLVDRLSQAAKAMSVDLATYLRLLEQCREGRLDHKACDAARFMLSRHSESLRKLSQ